MDSKITIAIDGPAGAGKSTVAKELSRVLGIMYLDTGAMYRAIAYRVIKDNINVKDKDSLESILNGVDIEMRHLENGKQCIMLDGQDVSKLIRTHDISIAASNISAIELVRQKMTQLQRQIAYKNSVVMDGRDIGTVVLPKANFKFYLNASIQERAKRRYLEELASSSFKDVSLEQVTRNIQYRDQNDSTRAVAPLKKAQDAVEIDTTHMNVKDVVNAILNIINARGDNGGNNNS